MKKLKTLCAVIGAAILAMPALASKNSIPQYNLEEAEKKVEYGAWALGGICPIEDPSKLPNSVPLVTITKYGFDRNQDRKIDLVHKETECEGSMYVEVYIDDDFDGDADRRFLNGKAKIYDMNEKIEDLF